MLENIQKLYEVRMNKHQTHMEDVIIFGEEGFSELLSKCRSMLSILEGTSPEKNMTITTKIDGSPALVIWTKFDDNYLNRPGVSLKRFITAKTSSQAEKTAFFSPEEVTEKYGDRPDICNKINGILNALISGELEIPEGEAWQGDLLFDANTIRTYSNEDGDNFVTFQPNTIMYAVPAESETAIKIKNSKVGIAFHTRYTGEIGNLYQTFNLDVNKDLIKCPQDLYIIDAKIPNLSGQVSFNKEESAIVSQMINELTEYYNKLTGEYHEDYEDLCSNEDFIKMYFQTYQNKVIADDQQAFFDEDNFIENLKNYCADKIENECNKKVPALKTEKGRIKASERYNILAKEIYDIIENNSKVIECIVAAINVAVEIKQAFMEKLYQAKMAFDTYYITNDGVVPGTQEGIAISDDEGNIVKLVDRTCFSFHNRDSSTIKGWEHTGDIIHESINSIFNEDVKTLTANEFTKNDKYKDYIENELEAEFVHEKNATKDNYDGLFIKNDGKPNIEKNSDAYNKAIDYGHEVDNGKVNFDIDGEKIGLSISSKPISQRVNNGITCKYIPQGGSSETALQEAITASILEMKAHGVILEKSTENKISDLEKWFLDSDPIEKTGICEYIDFNVEYGDEYTFKTELKNFLHKGSPSWIKSFNTLWDSDVIKKISDVFVEPITSSMWQKASFYHFNKIGAPESIKKYLSKYRCGTLKDNIDKSDIVLAFDFKEADKDALRLCRYKSDEIDKHNSDMNELLGNKYFIGISLKKLKDSITISSTNFSADSTGIGPKIADESKVFVAYYDEDNKMNTIKDISILGNITNKSTRFEVTLENPKDMHLKSSTLILSLRSNSNDPGRVVELTEKNAAAQMGKVTDNLKAFGFDANDEFKKAMDISQHDMKKAQILISEKLLNILSDKKVLSQVIAKAAGYPFYDGKNDSYELNGAPYIKIF